MSYLLKMLNCKHYDTLTDRHPPKCKWLVYQWLNVDHIYNDGIKKHQQLEIKTILSFHSLFVFQHWPLWLSVTLHQCCRSFHGVYSYIYYIFIIRAHNARSYCNAFCVHHALQLVDGCNTNEAEQYIRFVKNKIKAENIVTLLKMLVLYTVRWVLLHSRMQQM